MPNFEHVRISLAKWDETPLFLGTPGELSARPRADVLREVFGEQRDFVHRARLITFLPVDSPDGFAAGYFGREIRIHGHTKKESRFEPEDIDTYDLAFFAVDLDADKQTAVVQQNGRVGDPRALLESFFASQPVRGIARDYQIHVKHLSSERGYYEAAKEYKGEITKVIFTFIPPNALKSEEKIWAFIEEASREAGSESLRHEYDSPHGNLDPTADLLAGSEKVAAAGGGETIMRSGRKTIFNSVSHKIKTYVSSMDMPESWNKLQIESFINYLFHKKK